MARGEFKEEDFEEIEEGSDEDKLNKKDNKEKSAREDEEVIEEKPTLKERFKKKWESFKKRRNAKNSGTKRSYDYDDLKEELIYDTLYHANHFFKLCNFFLWLAVIAFIFVIVWWIFGGLDLALNN